MNITKNQIDDLNATIKIELGKEDYAGRVESALKDYQRKVVIDGFRKGKTPMGIVKKMYGKALLVEEINKVLGEALSNYIKDNNLQILGEPLPNETDQKELNLEDENFEFLYDIALSPEVNAKMSKREKVPFYSIKVDDEMIDKQIENICKNNGNMILVDEIIRLNQPDAFKDVFLVVIQLGAILAVVVMFFHKLNPFSPSKSSRQKDATWALWIKIIIACVPAAILGLLLDDWLEAHQTDCLKRMRSGVSAAGKPAPCCCFPADSLFLHTGPEPLTDSSRQSPRNDPLYFRWQYFL